MSLIVSTRTEPLYIRFEVSGHWRHGDALKLAYQAKSAAVRTPVQRFLLDLRAVVGDEGNPEKFLICDRLLRVFEAPARLALVGDADLIDCDNVTVAHDAPTIALFMREHDAYTWLMA
jgi:hypothetical protein